MQLKEIRKKFPKDYSDRLGHLNFPGFQKLMWIEVEKLLNSLGIGVSDLGKINKALVIRNVNVDYFKMLHDNDDTDVFVEITKTKKFKLFFSGKITRGEETVCTATFTMGCIDKKTGKPAQIPEF